MKEKGRQKGGETAHQLIGLKVFPILHTLLGRGAGSFGGPVSDRIERVLRRCHHSSVECEVGIPTLPVPRGSAEPVARLTRRPVPLAVRQLRDFNRGP